MAKLCSVTFDRVIEDNWLHYTRSNIPTVPLDLLKAHKYADRMHIIQNDITGIAYYRDGSFVRSTLYAGYAFNGADIPRLVNKLFRNIKWNNKGLVRGAFFHDPCFNWQILGLKKSADLLTDVSHYCGTPAPACKLVNMCTKGNIARGLYRERDDFDRANSKFCTVEIGA